MPAALPREDPQREGVFGNRFVLFRGPGRLENPFRLKIPFKDLTSVEAADGILRLEFAGSEAAFELGEAAAKWAAKILHPPSRLDKLGVKPGSPVALVGEFEADFLEELRARKAAVLDGRASADLLFLAAGGARDLARIPKLIARLALLAERCGWSIPRASQPSAKWR